jgi:hypothetical protein
MRRGRFASVGAGVPGSHGIVEAVSYIVHVSGNRKGCVAKRDDFAFSLIASLRTRVQLLAMGVRSKKDSIRIDLGNYGRGGGRPAEEQ